MNGADMRKVTASWWRDLQPLTPAGKPNWRADRAALARLRHMDDPAEAMSEPAVLTLYKALGLDWASRRRLEWVAAAAMAMAHVRTDNRRHPARVVGPAKADDWKGESAAMKPLRFKRLMQAREAADVTRQMRRLVALAGSDGVDVGRLAQAILDWADGDRGDRCRVGWTYTYYDAENSAPAA